MIGITNAVSSVIGRIVVSYPVGSICTCTNEYDTVTYTAKDTSGACVFNIMSLGTWTVSCTDGSRTTSATVVIDAWWQSKTISLSYTKMLIENGIPQVPFTVSTRGTLTPGSDLSPSTNYATFTTGGNYAVIAHAKVDLTSFSQLNISLASGNMSYCNTTDNACPAIGVASSVPDIDISAATVTPRDGALMLSTASVFEEVEKTMDIADFTGEKYVFITVSGSSQFYSQAGVLNIIDFYAI